jgi:hypothetical protein
MNEPSHPLLQAHPRRRPPLYRRASLYGAPCALGLGVSVAVLLAGCAQRAQPAPVAAASTPAEGAEAPRPEPPAEGTALAAPRDSAHSEEEASQEGETEEALQMDQKSAEKKEAPFEFERELTRNVSAFDEALGGAELSCDGAQPLKEAICAIAKRVCEMKDVHSGNQANQCAEAKKACSRAEGQFKSKCS